MPIRPSERGRYPKDWKAIRAAIMKRARNRCEYPGDWIAPTTCRCGAAP